MGDTKNYITADELKKHNKREDLWISIQGKVYNVTEWIKEHPGGDMPVLSLAGQEATDAFIAFHPERVLFVLISFAVTGIQHIQFCLNHFGADVYVGQPKGNDWFEKQTAGTIDIDCYSWMDWFYGGLQFQLEHHLFPRLPRCQLRKISPIVQELCKKHNLSYRSLSFYEANLWTIKTLRTAAMQARSLLWEAVNTHG